VPEEDFPPAIPGEFGFAASGQCVTTAGPRDAWIATSGGGTARRVAVCRAAGEHGRVGVLSRR
jgi:hypothetical protein